ncbi:hypothetical protein I4U23_027510 [Adineta vaga]|nr:hypothetical protein I4U23_027510 [Adineta vaga]
MSSSNATLAEINALNYGNIIFYQFWSYLLIGLGTIGHSLNIYVFARPILRSNPCTRYFLAATISGIFVTYTNVLLRLLQKLDPKYDLFAYSTVSCKILSFVVLHARCVTSCLGPSLMMLIFGSLTIRHIQRSAKTVAVQTTQVQNQMKRQKTTDRQLIQMMLVQCLYFSLLTTPSSVYYLYSSITMSTVSSPLQMAKNSLFSNITGILSITGACTSFYVFTLSSKLFRRELMKIFKHHLQTNQMSNANVMQMTNRFTK